MFYYVLTIFYFILLGLDEYTTFNVSVAANNSLGIGPYSQPVEVKTLESSKSMFFVDLIGCTTCYIVYNIRFQSICCLIQDIVFRTLFKMDV